MALSLDFSPLRDFIDGLSGETSAIEFLWQVGVAATAVVLGWYAARVICRQIKPNPKWKFGEGDFERVAYPLLVWVFMAIGKLTLERFQPVALLQILLVLLVAWIAIRIAVYVLGHILPQGGVLRGAVKIVALIAWVAVALHIVGLLPEVIEALEDIGITVGTDKARITLWLVLQALAALALTLTVAAWISSITESRVLASQNVEMSTKIVIAKLVRVTALFLAVLVALPLVGIPITALSVFSGALGVGLGFGLQKIAANYVSGFIVLLDRSLRIGDLITVDNRRGVVMAIEARYTVIKGSDGTESIIPNEKLITETVNHHTFSDSKSVLVISVSIAYGSDVDRACELLVEIALRHERVLHDPRPLARVKLLSESSIDLEMVAWLEDIHLGDADLKSDLLRAILKSFDAARIELPFPRRDIRILATPETQKTSANSRV
ncbi:MAG TPA: mechanosensitive ion channel domain-containing protein [Usitatibacter sp.]|nr:mechanosensitive ion channel domain-containing protein [Usitatibacter sp.]